MTKETSREEELRINFLHFSKETETNFIAVSKTHPSSDIQTLYDLGQRDFGENKVQELLEKSETLIDSCPEIRWHFIGMLQSNKVKMLAKVSNLVSIHSIDSIKLLYKITRQNFDKKVGCFIQVNTSEEPQKNGFTEMEEIIQAVGLLVAPEGDIFLQGLMTLSRVRTQSYETDAEKCFKALVTLREKLGTHLDQPLELSMGMSNDYHVAVRNGSDWLRIGSVLFGKRG